MTKDDNIKTWGAATRGSLAFLFSLRSLGGLLVANLIVFTSFVGGCLYAPWSSAGMDVGAGIIQPLSYAVVQGVLYLSGMSCLAATIFLAVPVISYMHAKGKTEYKDFILILFSWAVLICLLMGGLLAIAFDNSRAISSVFVIFPIIWLPTWIAAVTYWRIALKQAHHEFKLFTKAMFILALLIWTFLSMNFGMLMATD